MKTSKVLQLIQTKLLTSNLDHRHYLCHIAQDLFLHKKITSHDCVRVKSIFNELLHPFHSLEAWLDAEHCYVYADAYLDAPFADHTVIQKLNTTRLAWLDHLIAHYLSKKD